MRYKELYENYLNLRIKTKAVGFFPVKCPFHNDNAASAAVDLDTGVFKCFACDLVLSPQRFLQKIAYVDHVESFNIIKQYQREDEVIGLLNTRLPNPTLLKTYEDALTYYLHNKNKPEVAEAIEQWEEDNGITKTTLESVNIGYIPNRGLVVPYWVGNQLASLLVRRLDGVKTYVKGSYNCLWGLHQLTSIGEAILDNPWETSMSKLRLMPRIYLVEGLSDGLRLKQELPNEIVLATPGNSFREEWLRELEGISEVVLIRQADSAGQKLVDSAYKCLRERLRVYSIPFKRGQFGNDICDWFNSSGLGAKELLQSFNVTHDLIVGEPLQVGHLKIFDGFALKTASREAELETPYVTNLINPGELGLIVGKAKSRKTMLTLNLMKCLANPNKMLMNIPECVSGNERVHTLLIEEEGSLKSLEERVEGIFTEEELEYCHFIHRSGYRITKDNVLSVADNLLMLCKAVNAKVLFLDPLQRLVDGDEDKASESKAFWDALHYMVRMEPELCIIPLHHFTKSGSIKTGWDAIRGTSRMSGEVDFGIFVESKDDNTAIRVEGRNLAGFEVKLIYRDFRLYAPGGAVSGGIGNDLAQAGIPITDAEQVYINTLDMVFKGIGPKYQIATVAGIGRSWANKIVKTLEEQGIVRTEVKGKTTTVILNYQNQG